MRATCSAGVLSFPRECRCGAGKAGNGPVFQRFLTGELGDHPSSQLLAASALVAALNTTLATVRTSHGLGVTLDRSLADGVEADVKAAVDLLRSPYGLRTREQSEQLRDVLQRRIEDARRADPFAGYAAHLRTAPDYRDWFPFTPWVVNDAAPGSRRKLSGRTGLSQGEQRVPSCLVLFAAAAAHFTGLAATAPQAPRLILLDDAFAKVDEPTHARLGPTANSIMHSLNTDRFNLPGREAMIAGFYRSANALTPLADPATRTSRFGRLSVSLATLPAGTLARPNSAGTSTAARRGRPAAGRRSCRRPAESRRAAAPTR
ncbi:SbcC/MukB-like Walker B domain-containing protein [Streptomyces sp. NPDC097107]|uniref:SbcC/MukB-like Walker B domain-containing protein n=1 Tax=Streptomyces sp. NPDC097107 TaxID=3366089 RepID=UPI0037F80EC2